MAETAGAKAAGGAKAGGLTALAKPAADASAARTEAAWSEVGAAISAWLRRRVTQDTADDLLQEVFLRVHTRADSLRDWSQLRAWVFRIARNVLLDHYRRQGRERLVGGETEQHSGDLPHSDLPPAALAGTADEPALLRQLLGAWLKLAIQRLPERYREVMVRTELRGEAYAAVAAELGLTRSGVKTRVARGRERLRVEMARCCDLEHDARGRVVAATPRSCPPEACCD